VCGVSNPDTLWPHALRAHFTTKLANDMGVSMKETMAAARHTTAEASAMYQTTSALSEARRHNALLGPTPKNKANDSLARSRKKVVLDDSDDDFVRKPKRKSNNFLVTSRNKRIRADSDDDFVIKPKSKPKDFRVRSKRKRIIVDSDDDCSEEDFEESEEEIPALNLRRKRNLARPKFEIRIETSDEESFSDDSSDDGDKKLPAKNDIVAKKNQVCKSFLFTLKPK
jgi:hypothetical protein